MSTEIGVLKNSGSRNIELFLTRFWGGNHKGLCVQLSAIMEGGITGYIQLSTSDIIAILPLLKKYIMDPEMKRQKELAESSISKYKELEHSIVSDMRDIAKMNIDTGIYEVSQLLFYGKNEVELADEIKEEENE